MSLEGVKVGDEVWHKWSDHHRGGRTLVKTVGRKWITVTDGGRFDPVTGWGDDKTPGRLYASEAAYVEKTRTRDAWWDTMQKSHPNMGEKMSLETIQQVRALLGLPAWEG
jgi:hypothetical protein